MGRADLIDLLTTIIAPALTAAAVLVWSWRLWKRDAPNGCGPASTALAFGAAYALGHALMFGRIPEIPPRQVEDWVWVASVVGVMIGAGTPLLRMRLAWLAVLLLSCAQAWVIVAARARPPWESAWVGYGVWIGSGVATMLAWVSLTNLSKRVRGGVVPTCLCLALMAAGFLYFKLYASASGAQMAGVLTSACGGAAVLGWWRPRLSIGAGGAMVIAMIFAGQVLVVTLFGADASPWPAILAYAGVHGAWIGELPVCKRLGPRWRATIRIIAVALSMAALVACVWVAERGEAGPFEDMYGRGTAPARLASGEHTSCPEYNLLLRQERVPQSACNHIHRCEPINYAEASPWPTRTPENTPPPTRGSP